MGHGGARRNDDASDADVAVYEEQVRTAEPLTGAEAHMGVRHRAGADPSGTLMDVLDRVVAQPRGGSSGRDAGRARPDGAL